MGQRAQRLPAITVPWEKRAKEMNQLPKGDWEVTGVDGIDEAKGG